VEGTPDRAQCNERHRLVEARNWGHGVTSPKRHRTKKGEGGKRGQGKNGKGITEGSARTQCHQSNNRTPDMREHIPGAE